MLPDRALIQQTASFHQACRGEVPFITLTKHPVKAERAKPKIHVFLQDLLPVPTCLEPGEEDNPDLARACLVRVYLKERQSRKLIRCFHSGSKDIGDSWVFLRFIDGTAEECGDLNIVIKPEKYIPHYVRVARYAVDVVKVFYDQIYKDETSCFERKTQYHLLPVLMPYYGNMQG